MDVYFFLNLQATSKNPPILIEFLEKQSGKLGKRYLDIYPLCTANILSQTTPVMCHSTPKKVLAYKVFSSDYYQL